MVLLRLDDIRAKQSEDAMIAEVVKALESGEDWESSAFKKVRTQLSVVDGMLQRSVKLPPNDVQNVPVIPLSLEKSVIPCGTSANRPCVLGNDLPIPEQSLLLPVYVQQVSRVCQAMPVVFLRQMRSVAVKFRRVVQKLQVVRGVRCTWTPLSSEAVEADGFTVFL